MSISGQSKLTLKPWPDYTDDEHILLTSDTLLTVCEPTEVVRDAYLKKIGKTLEELTSSPEPVMLTEDETVPDGEDYEPRYVEDPIY